MSIPSTHIVRVAVDGVDGAGKTCFADELADEIRLTNRPVIRASVDGFHNPRSIRYRKRRDSPDGFYLDSYDYNAFRSRLLDPLSPGGSGVYRVAVFEHVTDASVSGVDELARPELIAIIDGIFLHRRELAEYWDFSIFLKVDFHTSISRAADRDGLGSHDAAAQSNARYVEGQERYLRESHPEAQASVVVANTDLRRPKLLSLSSRFQDGQRPVEARQ